MNNELRNLNRSVPKHTRTQLVFSIITLKPTNFEQRFNHFE